MKTIRLYRRASGWWYADLRQLGLGRVSTGLANKREARAWAEDYVEGKRLGISSTNDPQVTLCNVIHRAYVEHYSVNKVKGLATHRSTLFKLELELGEDLLVKDLTTQRLAQYRDELVAGKMLSNATINRRLAYLSKLLRLSAEWGYLTAAPAMPSRLHEGTERHRELSEAEQDLLVHFFNDVGRPWMADLMVFLVETGARLSEALRISADDRENASRCGFWVIPETKAGKPRTVPLTDMAVQCLRNGGWLGLKKRNIQHVWDLGRKHLGLTEDAGFVLHCLRHTCASRMLQKGATLEEVAAWLGHSGTTVTRRYAKLSISNLGNLRDRLEGWSQEGR